MVSSEDMCTLMCLAEFATTLGTICYAVMLRFSGFLRDATTAIQP